MVRIHAGSKADGLAFPFGERQNSALEGQLLAAEHRASPKGSWPAVGEFSGHAPYIQQHIRARGRQPKMRADQMGHGVRVNVDVYTQTDLEQRLEAVNQVENAVLRGLME